MKKENADRSTVFTVTSRSPGARLPVQYASENSNAAAVRMIASFKTVYKSMIGGFKKHLEVEKYLGVEKKSPGVEEEHLGVEAKCLEVEAKDLGVETKHVRVEEKRLRVEESI